jgi:hypothetical protein
MTFTFKLAKRLALSKAVRTTVLRALSALPQASTHPAFAVPASSPIRHAVAEQPRAPWGAVSCQEHHC